MRLKIIVTTAVLLAMGLAAPVKATSSTDAAQLLEDKQCQNCGAIASNVKGNRPARIQQQQPIRTGNLQQRLQHQPIQTGNTQQQQQRQPIRTGNTQQRLQHQPIRTGNTQQRQQRQPIRTGNTQQRQQRQDTRQERRQERREQWEQQPPEVRQQRIDQWEQQPPEVRQQRIEQLQQQQDARQERREEQRDERQERIEERLEDRQERLDDWRDDWDDWYDHPDTVVYVHPYPYVDIFSGWYGHPYSYTSIYSGLYGYPYSYHPYSYIDTYPDSWYSDRISTEGIIRVELTSLSQDRVTVSIDGGDSQQEVAFNSDKTKQVIYLPSGTHRLCFKNPTGRPWMCGSLSLGRKDRVRIAFNEDNKLVEVYDDPQAWREDESFARRSMR